MKLNFEAKLNPPAADESIDELAAKLGFELPPAYRELLRLANGFAAKDILIYGTHEVPEINAVYELAIYNPSVFAIGDDGGGEAILLAKDFTDTKVYHAGHGSLAHMHVLAPSLESWLAQQPKVFDDDDGEIYPAHYPIDVYLEGMPAKGIKLLLQIKEVLGLQMGIGQLKSAAERGSTRILENVPYGKYKLRCQRIDDAAEFLTLCIAGDRASRLPIHDP